MAFDPLQARRCRVASGIGLLLAAGAMACASRAARFPAKPPLLDDPDRSPFAVEPQEYYSPLAWDGADQTVFRPISRLLAVDPAGDSKNVNAVDEVPNSSWFQGRLGQRTMTPEEVALGPCAGAPLEPAAPWTVVGAKPNGANPGFIIKAADGRRYLLKFDGVVEGPRPTAADVVGSRLYHAAGYYVPCNRIVNFDRNSLRIDPLAEAEDEQGNDVPLRQQHLDRVFAKALRLKDGRFRANASLFIDGKPIGPWTYQGLRADDPNDVVIHEDRRELRGSALFAAWTNHFDAREQNTLAAWMKQDGGLGYVRHYLIDFGDCFGSIWEPPLLGRRIGHAHYLDFGYLAEDFVTLGAIERPWDTARFGSTGATFGYYDSEQFAPEAWRPGYPNPAFSRMQEADAAWAARIIARFTDAHVYAMVAEAKLPERAQFERLASVIIARRDKILRRYLTRISPLTAARLDSPASPAPRSGELWLCMDDLALTAGVVTASERRYAAHLFTPDRRAELTVYADGQGSVCAMSPSLSKDDAYAVIDVWAYGKDHTTFPLRVHLSSTGPGEASTQIVGVERPASHQPFSF